MRQKFIGIILALCAAFTSLSASADEKVEFTTENTVVLRGEVNDVSIAKAMAGIISNPKDEVYLFINSPGGSIVDGLRLVALLRATDKKVTCVTNFAASMAFVIMQACDRRLVTEDAIMMQHVAAYGLQGQEPNNWSMAKFIRRMVKKMDEMQAKRIGISYAKFKSLTRDDWWLFDGEAVTAGVADASATATCSKELSKKTTKEEVNLLFFTVEVVWSDCPLIEGPLSIKPVEKQRGRGSRQAAEEYQKFLEKLNFRATLMQRISGSHAVQMPMFFQ